jgi:hypothetical protein
MRQANVGGAAIGTAVGDLVSSVGSASDFIIQTNIQFTEDPASKLNDNPLYTELEGAGLKNYYLGSKTSIDFLLNTSDPRIDYLYTAPGGGHRGLLQGDQSNLVGSYSRPKGGKNDPPGGDAYLYGPNVPFILMSTWEEYLLLSEAAARGWISDDANELYDNAVQASFDYYGAGDPSSYLAAGLITDQEGGGFDNSDLDMELLSIGWQKWVCMNGLQAIESYIETRRMDDAAVPMFMSSGGLYLNPPLSVLPPGVFPSVSYYSESEVSFNPNITQHALTDKIFWDN